jgi:NADH:ubiquinone oxidoreductase subunit K
MPVLGRLADRDVAQGGGQVFALMSMAVAACEVAVGLALIIAFFRRKQSVMATDAAEMQG